MSEFNHIQQSLVRSLFNSQRSNEPYTHWLLQDCLPPAVADALCALPFEPPQIDDTGGRRETHNASRVHFGMHNRMQHQVMDKLAHALQDQMMVDVLKLLLQAPLSGTSLRIEYCQDSKGFWLEPHTDIGVKRFTMLIYLNREPQAADWGTDIYAGSHRHFGRVPAGFNSGLIFVPGDDTWHGFEPRRIDGVRKVLIVNYVSSDWLNTQELCFPGAPVK